MAPKYEEMLLSLANSGSRITPQQMAARIVSRHLPQAARYAFDVAMRRNYGVAGSIIEAVRAYETDNTIAQFAIFRRAFWSNNTAERPYKNPLVTFAQFSSQMMRRGPRVLEDSILKIQVTQWNPTVPNPRNLPMGNVLVRQFCERGPKLARELASADGTPRWDKFSHDAQVREDLDDKRHRRLAFGRFRVMCSKGTADSRVHTFLTIMGHHFPQENPKGGLFGVDTVMALHVLCEFMGAIAFFDMEFLRRILNRYIFPLLNGIDQRPMDVQILLCVCAALATRFGNANFARNIPIPIARLVTTASLCAASRDLMCRTYGDSAPQYNKDGDYGRSFDVLSHRTSLLAEARCYWRDRLISTDPRSQLSAADQFALAHPESGNAPTDTHGNGGDDDSMAMGADDY